jgi:hypothetical protein
MAQLDALQLAAGDASSALNTRGDTLEARLQDVPVRAREVARHGVRHGAVVALAIAQARSGHDLHSVEPSFPEEENPDDYHDLVDDFKGAGVVVVNITAVKEAMNYVFLGP